MNYLNVLTVPTVDPLVFDTYWATGQTAKGRVIVTVTPDFPDDGRIVAELGAVRYLLEDRNVCGHDKTARGLVVTCSCGAIRKLLREESFKSYLAPYANFLRTRFLGIAVEVEKRKLAWADEGCDRDTAELVVDAPIPASLHLGEFGEVEITGHAVQRYAERFGVRPDRAWRRLREQAPGVCDLGKVTSSMWKALSNFVEARIGVNREESVIFVVVPPARKRTLPSLVTVYAPSQHSVQLVARLKAGLRKAA